MKFKVVFTSEPFWGSVPDTTEKSNFREEASQCKQDWLQALGETMLNCFSGMGSEDCMDGCDPQT